MHEKHSDNLTFKGYTKNSDIMPYKEHVVEKVYYTIGEVVKGVNKSVGLTGKKSLTPSLLRFYESYSVKLRASKINKNRERRYTQGDYEIIERFVKIRSTGWFTLKGCVSILAGTLTVKDHRNVKKGEES